MGTLTGSSLTRPRFKFSSSHPGRGGASGPMPTGEAILPEISCKRCTSIGDFHSNRAGGSVELIQVAAGDTVDADLQTLKQTNRSHFKALATWTVPSRGIWRPV